MTEATTILVVSDIHYAGKQELSRRDPEGMVVESAWLRPIASGFRKLWLGDDSKRNAAFRRFLECAATADLVVANGDFSCDSAFVGVSDEAAFASSQECLKALKAKYGESLRATIGDHELGRRSLFGGAGGPRIESWNRSVDELELQPFWQSSLGKYTLLGVSSSLLDLDSAVEQVLPDELSAWQQLREEHLEKIRQVVAELPSERRLILFCHDPAALEILALEPVMQARIDDIEQTFVGHIHSRTVAHLLVLKSHRRKTLWHNFKVRLCPALACGNWPALGLYYEVTLDPSGRRRPQYQLRTIDRKPG